jgi:site-specific DNA-cytosine methylase
MKTWSYHRRPIGCDRAMSSAGAHAKTSTRGATVKALVGFHRLIEERPRYAIIENVAVVEDWTVLSLSKIGYDAEWNCISASSVGSP